LLITLPGCSCGGSAADRIARSQRRHRDTGEDETPSTRQAAKPPKHTSVPNTTANSGNNSDGPSPPAVGSPRNALQVVTQIKLPARPLAFDPLPPIPAVDAPAEAHRAAAIARMKRIAQAMVAYRKQNGHQLPAAAYVGTPPTAVLSWRVLLLPYLGEAKLFNRFNLKKKWDSEQNEEFLWKMPDVYRCSGAKGAVYQVPVLADSLFNQPKAADGEAHTVMLLEVNPQYAVPWTKPADYDTSDLSGLSNFRSDGFFVAWGDGSVARIAQDAPLANVQAAFTANGKEGIVAVAVSQAAEAKPANAPAAAVAATTPPPMSTPTDLLGGGPPLDIAEPAAAASPLFETARALLAQGYEKEALLYYHGAVAAGDPTIAWQEDWRWFAGLRRPAALVRWGIGIDYTGAAPGKGAEFNTVNRDSEAYPLTEETAPGLTAFTGEAGGWMLEHIRLTETAQLMGESLPDTPLETAPAAARDNRAPFRVGRPVASRQETSPTTLGPMPLVARHPNSPVKRMAAAVYYVGTLSKKNSIELAKQEGLDVLVLFNVEARNARSTPSITTSISLIDLWTNQEIFESKTYNNIQVKRLRLNPLLDDPMLTIYDPLRAKISGEFSGAALPEELQPTHVRGRIAKLTTARLASPLPTIAEVRYYLEKGLIAQAEAKAAFAELTDEATAAMLVSNDPDVRLSAVKKLLPELKYSDTASNGARVR